MFGSGDIFIASLLKPADTTLGFPRQAARNRFMALSAWSAKIFLLSPLLLICISNSFKSATRLTVVAIKTSTSWVHSMLIATAGLFFQKPTFLMISLLSYSWFKCGNPIILNHWHLQSYKTKPLNSINGKKAILVVPPRNVRTSTATTPFRSEINPEVSCKTLFLTWTLQEIVNLMLYQSLFSAGKIAWACCNLQ